LDALTRLSGDAQTFTEKVWAHAIHIHHADPDAYTDLLSLDDVDALLTSTAIRTPMVRLAKDGSVLLSRDYTRTTRVGGVPVSGLVDAAKVLAAFDAGATVILQALHRYWLPLNRLVTDLEQALGHPCQANAYLTPASAQGFARHSDTHDVFVFQTYGDKQWQVEDDSGVHEVRMRPGMSMYLPTGTPHSARAQDGTSLHVTVGINRVTWRDVLVNAVESALPAEWLDEPLPAGYHRDRDTFERALDERLSELRKRLGDVDAGDVARDRSVRFLGSRSPSLRGGLVDRVALSDLDDDTLLRWRPGASLTVLPDGDALRAVLADRELGVPARVGPALAYLEQHSELTPADLGSMLDLQSRLVLLRRLVREGLLEVAR